ncbi:MAG TPA: DUF3598 family protein [Leptolyngbyaceae cyanobacterium]
MKSQWECLLQNLGEWQGSFTRISPQGELLEDTPTVVSLVGLNNNQMVRQTVRRFLPSQLPQDTVLEYSSLGRNTLFFENGAFSQGSIQLAPFTVFGAELGLIDGNRRLRLVQMFDKQGNLETLTLIREKLAGTDENHDNLVTSVDSLWGEWQGEAVTLYPDFRSPDSYATKLKIYRNEDGKLFQELNFANRTIASSAKVDGPMLYFEEGFQPVRVLLLPAGASCTFPLTVKLGQAFFLEVGWLINSHHRQRLIRNYNEKGEWVSLTLVEEFKI